MSYQCYILYSKRLDRYYVGSTSLSIEERVEQHNSSFFGKSKFTSVANDWQVFHTLICNTRKQAESVEAHIKSMKSSKYILNLRKYPEMSAKLLERYS